MRDFSARADIDNTDPTNYPDGRILDSSPASAKNGTAIEESALLGDIFQMFLKVVRDAGITVNGNPDNVTNGYQLFDAMTQGLVQQNNVIDTAQIAQDAVTDNELDDETITHFVLNGGNTGSNTKIRTRIITIGDWNMDSTGMVDVSHGLGASQHIRGLDAIVRDDTNTLFSKIDSGINNTDAARSGFIAGYTSSIVRLYRTDSGIFDNTAYNQTSYNRGWITITYEDAI